MKTITRVLLVGFLFLNFVSAAQESNSVVKKSTEITVINGKKYFLHTVQQGESLYAISKAYQVQISDIVSSNPDAANGIKPNDVLKIPDSQNGNSSIKDLADSLKYDYHKVVHGETLYSLSKKAGITVSDFIALNPEAKNGLKAGETVKTPKKKSSVKMSETEIQNANPAVKKYESVAARKTVDSVKTAETIVNAEKLDTTSQKNIFPTNGIYNIALFLPFNLDNIDSINVDAIARGTGTFPPRTKIALSFYEGAIMAIDSLKKQGFKCRVFVYSYGLDGSDSVIKKIFRKPEFSSMNLIIGPLYSSTFSQAEKLAKQKNIPIISPFIKQNKILFGYPNVFKAAPSDYTQIDSLANYVAANYSNLNVVVIKNDNSENNTNANLFKNLFLKASKNSPNEATFISKDFSGVHKYLSSSKKTIVVMLSEDQSYVTSFINSLENASENDSVILFGLQAIHGFDNLDLSYLNNLDFHFPSNIFVDYTNSNTNKFIEDYRNIYLTEPDQYVYQGFDVTYYCLNALKKYGSTFMQSLSQMKMQGIQTSFGFYKSSIESGFENRAVYILEYKNFELVKATK